MWPYSNDEQVWLVPSKEWAQKLPKPIKSETPTAVPANDINGAWPYAADDDSANDNRPFDPQTFVGK